VGQNEFPALESTDADEERAELQDLALAVRPFRSDQ
jgi:hypothetical protein